MSMNRQEMTDNVGAVVVYRPFADVIPERGILGGPTEDGRAYVWFTGKEAPEKVEPWCIDLHPSVKKACEQAKQGLRNQ